MAGCFWPSRHHSSDYLGNFLLRRFFTLILVWIGVTILVFFIANVVPSDPVAMRLGPKATPDAIAYWRHAYGLDLAPSTAIYPLL